MRGKRVAKGQMSRQLVYFCVAVLTAAAIWGVVMKSYAPDAELSDVLTFIGAAFGGELLLLAFKRVFAKEKTNREEQEDESFFEETDQS